MNVNTVNNQNVQQGVVNQQGNVAEQPAGVAPVPGAQAPGNMVNAQAAAQPHAEGLTEQDIERIVELMGRINQYFANGQMHQYTSLGVVQTNFRDNQNIDEAETTMINWINQYRDGLNRFSLDERTDIINHMIREAQELNLNNLENLIGTL